MLAAVLCGPNASRNAPAANSLRAAASRCTARRTETRAGLGAVILDSFTNCFHFREIVVRPRIMSRLRRCGNRRTPRECWSTLRHPTQSSSTGDAMKKSSMAILALALPTLLAAQQPSGSPPANPITTAFRQRTLGLQRNIAQAFDSIPESKFGYIAQHVASDDYFFCNLFGATKATVPEEETSTPDSVKAKWPKEKLVAQLKTSLAFCETALGQVDDSNLGDAVTMTFNGNSRNTTRVTMVLGHALDLEDHYSQL